MQVSQVIVDSCQKVAGATGTFLFVIDRAVHAVALARACDHQALGWRCMLDDNAQHGLESCAATRVDTRADGTQVSSGQWHVPRPEDPRHFVIVEPAGGQTLVSWGTPKVADVLEAAAWPRVSRERNERQAHRFKRLIDPGALTTNDGRKQLVGPDRHQQRARAQREQSLESARKRVDKKAEAVQMKQAHMAESEAQGHGKRLEQRQRAVAELAKAWQNAQDPHDQLTEQTNALRPPGERADRDVRTQTIMTVRTLRLENALRAFMVVLGARLQTQVRRDGLIRLLFERSGARMETDSQVVYWVNTAGFSVAYQRLLKELVEGLCAIDLQDQGTPICVRLKDRPP